MERWERRVDGRTEHWELERRGAQLVERTRADGAATTTRETCCDTEAMAEGIARRMVAQRQRLGFTPVASAAPEAPAKPARPSYPGLPDAKRDALILGVEKVVAGDPYKYADAIHKVTGDYPGRYAVAWFLVAHGLVAAERMPGLWELLAEAPELAPPAAVLDLVAKVPTGGAWRKLYKWGPMAWFVDGSSISLHALLFSAWRRDPSLCEAREATLPAPARAALDFARGCAGVALPPERARRLLENAARSHTRHGLASNWDLPVRDGDVLAKHRLADDAAVRAVALRFGSRAAWDALVVAEALAEKGCDLYRHREALRGCDTRELATLLGRVTSFGSNDTLRGLLQIVEGERRDDPDALLEAAAALTEGGDRVKAVREMLAVITARRFHDAGRAVPEALDGLITFEFFSDAYHASIEPFVRGLAALPRDRALALAERQLAEAYGYASGLGALLAHPDDALLGRYFDKDAPNSYLAPRVVGRFGAAALPHLARVWELTPRTRRRSRHAQVLEALATVAREKEAIDPSWDRFVVFDEEGDETLRYWSTDAALVRATVLKGVPPERRAAILLTCARERRYPERSLAAAATLDDGADLDAVVVAVIERRSACERRDLAAALASLGARAVPGLRACTGALADADFVALLREALPTEVADAALAR